MPSVGVTATWGAETWANYVLEHLSTESVVLRAGVRRVDIQGKSARVPRLLTDGTCSHASATTSPGRGARSTCSHLPAWMSAQRTSNACGNGARAGPGEGSLGASAAMRGSVRTPAAVSGGDAGG